MVTEAVKIPQSFSEENLSSNPETRFYKPEEYIERMLDQGYPEHAEAYGKVIELALSVKEKGGHALLVGGGVRDAVLCKVSKDFDIEVHGLEASDVEQAVSTIGKVSNVGRAFGIIKVTLPNGLDLDVSLPRTDSKTGDGHAGFAINTDPFMGIPQAAKRRDFTMNALAADPLTGEIYDFYNGVEDIKNGILRVTDPERFGDDPLRVLRAMQFVGRFGLTIERHSAEVIRTMVPHLKDISKERFGEEWKKLLLKSEKPSLGLTAGMELGVFAAMHPELISLAQTPQDPQWHPEGDVWTHTLLTLDKAATIIRRDSLNQDAAYTVMLATLCHDLGKPPVTQIKDNRIISYGHEQEGAEPAKKFLISIGVDGTTREKVVNLVVNHMMPQSLYTSGVSDGAIRRLADRLHPASISLLVSVAEADHYGRSLVFEQADNQYPVGQWLLDRARTLAVEANKPQDATRGRDWITLGYTPGPIFGRLIELSNRLRDEKDWTREMILSLSSTLPDAQTAVNALEMALV